MSRVTVYPLFLALFVSISGQQDHSATGDVPHHMVNLWATNFGNIMSEVCRQNTSRDEIHQNYRRNARVVEVDSMNLLKPMVEQIVQMMGSKREAVQRIVDSAEAAALSHQFNPQLLVDYLNAKRLNEPPPPPPEYESNLQQMYSNTHPQLELRNSSELFSFIPINTTYSTVHVPTNVYDKAPNVMNAIYWSQKLDRVFATNYRNDPSLSWQYFGSSTGFMRQYPGMKWMVDSDEPDLYDCRVREWYIRAASSPKDLVILLDSSGSMTGLRMEIAKHVVFNILDTLNANDYVTIYSFSRTAQPLYPCFEDYLVQANLENVRHFKEALDTVETKELANFTSALTVAFEMLKKTQQEGRGAMCNQAIMLVTDGAPERYEHVFNTYNRPDKQVRMFTYQIGRDVADSEAAKWMACENKGYFTKVTTLAEVGEQVQKYIPVLARPWVLYRTQHPAIWTSVYADVSDPKLTDWLWEIRERARQYQRSKNYQKILTFQSLPVEQFNESMSIQCYNEVETFLNYGKKRLTRQEKLQIDAEEYTQNRIDLRESTDIDKWTLLLGRTNSEATRRGYKLMTSVAIPVYDKRKIRKRVAILLGVAGTDVPIREIQKLCPPHQLGVNGYSFIIDNNGYVLYHPDFRPVHRESTKKFQEILKPNYNAVDLSEVEIGAFDEPNFNFSKLEELRRNMIDRRSAETTFRVRQHYGELRRVIERYQRYSYSPIDGSPFSLAIVLPAQYGNKRVSGQVEVSQAVKSREPIPQYFEGPNWSVHPDWVYCQYDSQMVTDAHSLDTPQKEYLHFLRKAMTTPSFEWRSLRLFPAPQMKNVNRQKKYSDDIATYFCDRDLFQSVIFDARATMSFLSQQSSMSASMEGLYETFGAVYSFVATRSGFTRWKDHRPAEEQLSDNEPGFRHFRATDETWYRRAVDYNWEDSEAFVYSVPFDAGLRNESLVTATQAIFLQKEGHKAPTAVVGMQFLLSKFRDKFFSSAKCPSLGNCSQTCASDDLDCYLLDDSGYVIVSKQHEQTGRFFGEVEGTVLNALIQQNVYRQSRVFDYQGVCMDVISTGSSAWSLATPLNYIRWLLSGVVSRLVWLIVQTGALRLVNPELAWSAEQAVYDHERAGESFTSQNDDPISAGPTMALPRDREQDQCPPELIVGRDQRFRMAHINKTRLKPCHKHVNLLTLNPNTRQLKASLNFCHGHDGQSCSRKFVLEKLPYTNLLLLVVNTLCPCDNEPITAEPHEWLYDTAQDPDTGTAAGAAAGTVSDNATGTSTTTSSSSSSTISSSQCQRQRHELYRRRPADCQKYHAEEDNINMCGRNLSTPSTSPSIVLLVTCLLQFLLRSAVSTDRC